MKKTEMIKEFKECILKLKKLPSKTPDMHRIGFEIYFERRATIRLKTDLYWYCDCFDSYPLPRYKEDKEYNNLMIAFNKKIDEITYKIWEFEQTQSTKIEDLRDLFFGKNERTKIPKNPQNPTNEFWDFVWARHKLRGAKRNEYFLLRNLEKLFPNLSFWDLANQKEAFFFEKLNQIAKPYTKLNSMQLLQRFVRMAIKDDLFQNSRLLQMSPFKTSVQPKKLLVREEFEQIKTLLFSGVLKKSESEWLRMFCFSAAMRGLRGRSDCGRIVYGDIIDDVLYLTTQKDAKVVAYRLNDLAKKIVAMRSYTAKDRLFEHHINYTYTAKNLSKKLGFDVRMHDARRYFATALSEHPNSNEYVISQAMKVTVQTAAKYVKIREKFVQDVLDDLVF